MTQLSMPISLAECTPCPRPTWKNQEVIDAVVKDYGKKIFQWCNEETSLEDCEEAAKKLMSYAMGWDSDGYKLAKEMEDDGWQPDAQLVDELDAMHNDIDYEVRKLVLKWISIYDIKLDISIGSKAMAKIHRTEYEVDIMAHIPAEAKYSVFCPALQKPEEKGKSSYSILKEDVRPLV